MPTSPARPPQLVGRVFRGSAVVAEGLLTKNQLRSSTWRRLRQDVYADASLPVTPVRVDFAYPDLKIAIEYDGLWHAERQAFLNDRGRLNRLVDAAGWLCM